MDLRNDELPSTLQAFDLVDNQEVFLAEQVVNTQTEITNFTNRYTGKLIKAKIVAPLVNRTETHTNNTTVAKPKSSINAIMILVVLALLALAIYGFSTGWIQDKLNLNI